MFSHITSASPNGVSNRKITPGDAIQVTLAMQSMPYLTEMTFHDIFLSDERCFAEWKGIERVNFGGSASFGPILEFESRSATALTRIPRLRSLSIEFQIPAKPGDLAGLAESHSLEELRLNHFEVTDNTVAEIADIPQLRVLHLGYAAKNVTDAAVDSLLKLTKLEELNIESTAIGNTGARRLAELPQLRRLVVDDGIPSDATGMDLDWWRKVVPGDISDETVAFLRRKITEVYRAKEASKE
jgi:hypothetical protein